MTETNYRLRRKQRRRRPLLSKFPGTCNACGKRINAGDELAGVPGAWIHKRCQTPVTVERIQVRDNGRG